MSSHGTRAALLVPRDLVVPFRESQRFVRADHRPAGFEPLQRAWRATGGPSPRRDFTVIDESGDFAMLTTADPSPFIVAAAVSFDDKTYPAMARLFSPVRQHFFAGEEVKASGPRRTLTEREEALFLHDLDAAAAAGHCAITLGVLDRVSHRGGLLLRPGFDKAAVRQEFHLALLEAHASAFAPRTQSHRMQIDQCGLARTQEQEYERAIDRLFKRLKLGSGPRVDFVDSLLVEMVQLADLLAGTVRRRLDDPELADPDRFDALVGPLGQHYLLADLTTRT